MLEGKALRDRLRAGEICLGTWTASSDPCIAEMLTGSGYDFIVIDSEHGALGIESVQQDIMAMKGTGVAPIVRVPWNDAVLVKRVLDSGAAGVLIPLVRSAEEVEQAIAACMYPPAGIRGFGPRRPSNYERDATAYLATANESLVVWVQIEHIDAVNAIDAIVSTPRLDGVFIGSNDLSGSLGLLGQPRHPRVMEAIDKTIASAKAAGVSVGIAGPADPQAAFEWLSKGVQFITLGSDASLLIQASEASVQGVRRLVGSGAPERQ